MHLKIEDLIQDVLSPDTQKRNNAEKNIILMQQQDFSRVTLSLIEILVGEESRSDIRFTAGVILRNSLFSNDASIFLTIEAKWMQIDPEKRQKIKQYLIKNFSSQNVRAGIISATVLACIIRIEYPRQIWGSCFDELLIQFKTSNNLIFQKNIISTILSSILYLKELTPQETVFQFFTVKLSSENPQLIIHLLKSLFDAQEYLQKILCYNCFYIIKLLISLCNINEEITVSVIQNITKFIAFGANYVEDMNGLRVFINNLMQGDESIVIQAVEFFAALAELEADKKGNYISPFLSSLLPNLFYNLKKDDDFDDEDWTAHKASSSCLQVIASFVNILGDVNIRNYIKERLMSKDIKLKEEGIIALGSSLVFKFYSNNFQPTDIDGDDSFIRDNETFSFIAQSIPLILDEVRISHDLNVKIDEPIRNSSLWCLAKICETNYTCVDQINVLPILLEKCQIILQEKCKESYNAAWALSNICAFVANHTFDGCYENSLSLYYYRLIDVLVYSSDAIEFTNFALRNAVFTALQEAVRACTVSTMLVMENLWVYFTKKIYECLSFVNAANDDQFNVLEDLMSNYLILLQAVYQKNKEEKMGSKKKEMLNLFIEILLLNKTTALYADVYSSLSLLCEDKSYFIVNIDRFIPFICRDLESKDMQILISVVSLIGDITGAMSVGFLSCSNLIIPGLITCLQRNDVDKEIKPMIINIFGDISLSLGGSFEPYVEMCLNILTQIMSLKREINESYIDDLRRSVLNLLNCILVSMETCSKIKENLLGISEMIKIICLEDLGRKNTASCLVIVGDVIEFYGDRKKFKWMHEFVKRYENDTEFGNVARDVLERIS
ncbi:karyopherin Kap95 [Conglomerata obtusa]